MSFSPQEIAKGTFFAFVLMLPKPSVAHEPPEWPSRAGRQQMQVHLELGTDDVRAAVDHAIECGATLAAVQPQEQVRVMLDPDGHPFCLFPASLGAP